MKVLLIVAAFVVTLALGGWYFLQDYAKDGISSETFAQAGREAELYLSEWPETDRTTVVVAEKLGACLLTYSRDNQDRAKLNYIASTCRRVQEWTVDPFVSVLASDAEITYLEQEAERSRQERLRELEGRIQELEQQT